MPSWIRAAAGVCLLLSGAAGLVYEVVWERYLRSLMGNTTGAVTAVLAAFMGGIALGGWLFAGAAQRSPRRLRLYAWLELGCTLHALAFPALLWAVGTFHAWAIAGAEETNLGLELARLALACGLLLPPAVLMGGTVPLLAGEVGATHLPALYAANSLGAVAGCLAAGFWLIEWLGLRASLSLAACLNVLAAVIALVAARLGEGGALCRASAPEAGEVVAERPMLAGAFLSGAASMTLEVGWTRLLALLLGSSVHSFALMLACFITGITAGAWSIGPGVVGRSAAMGFVRGQVLAAFLALLALPLAHGLPTAFIQIKTSASWSFGAFQAVPPGSPYYPKAKFFEGITHVRMRRAQPTHALKPAPDVGEALATGGGGACRLRFRIVTIKAGQSRHVLGRGSGPAPGERLPSAQQQVERRLCVQLMLLGDLAERARRPRFPLDLGDAGEPRRLYGGHRFVAKRGLQRFPSERLVQLDLHPEYYHII